MVLPLRRAVLAMAPAAGHWLLPLLLLLAWPPRTAARRSQHPARVTALGGGEARRSTPADAVASLAEVQALSADVSGAALPFERWLHGVLHTSQRFHQREAPALSPLQLPIPALGLHDDSAPSLGSIFSLFSTSKEDKPLRKRDALLWFPIKVPPDSEDGSGEPRCLMLPSDWAGVLNLKSLRMVAQNYHEEEWRVRSAHDDLAMVLKVMKATYPATERKVAVMERLSAANPLGGDASGYVAKCFGIREAKWTKYVLMEHSVSLGDLFDALTIQCFELEAGDPRCRDNREDGTLYFPLEESLPLIVDILKGIRTLEASWFLHAALTPENIILLGGRAVVAGFEKLCVLGDAQVSCRDLAEEWWHETFACSSMWQAPEMIDGIPSGPSNHVWAAGLTLAYLWLGHNPVHDAVISWEPRAPALDMEAHGRKAIRDLVRRRFSVSTAPGFSRLDADLQEVLSKMLAADPAFRWTTDVALARLEGLAGVRGIQLPPAPERPDLTSVSTLAARPEAQPPEGEPGVSWN